MKNNQGFSLIELIIVIAIIALLSAGSIFGANMLGLGSAKSTVSRINAMLDSVQVENMTKNKKYYMVIDKNETDGKYYLAVLAGVQEISREQLKLVRGEITYTTTAGTFLVSSVAVPGRDTKPKLEICFQKDTGGVAANTYGEIISRIGVSSAGSSYIINLVEATGKHYIE